MARKTTCAVTILTLSLASPAMGAQSIYFSKPGVAPEVFAGDVQVCRELAEGVRAPAQPYVYAPNLYAVAATALFSGIMRSKERRRVTDNVWRTCMADKGYRRIAMTEGLEDELEGLKSDALAVRLHQLAEASETHGTELPR